MTSNEVRNRRPRWEDVRLILNFLHLSHSMPLSCFVSCCDDDADDDADALWGQHTDHINIQLRKLEFIVLARIIALTAWET